MKLSIRSRVLFLVLVGVLATLLAIGIVTFYALYSAQDAVTEQENAMSNYLSESMGSYAEEQAKLRLKEVAEAKAQHLDRELTIIGEDVEYMADSMSHILSSPQYYNPRLLPSTRQDIDIFSDEPYIHYSAEMMRQGIDADLQREIDLASNFADTLVSMGKSYSGYHTYFYAGSKNGYMICMDVIPDDEEIKTAFASREVRENFVNEYDPRERLWYKFGQQVNKPTFNVVYNDGEGHLDLSCAMPYFDKNGFAGVTGLSYSIDAISKSVTDSIAKDTDICHFVIDDRGDIVISTEKEGLLADIPDYMDLRQNPNPNVAEAAKRMVDGESGVMTIEYEDEVYYLAFAPMKTIGWSYGTLIDNEEIVTSVEKVKSDIHGEMENFKGILRGVFIDSMTNSAVFLIPVLIFLFFGSKYMSARLTRPISKLADGVKEISSGNFDKKLEIKTGDEIEHLAICFNAMTDELKEYTKNLAQAAAKEERNRTELEVAAKIQSDMLPCAENAFPDRNEFDIYASMNAAKDVGGDFYDFYMLDDDHLVVTIADVSGKGVPAALFMAMSQTILKNCVMMTKEPENLAAALESANERLCQNNDAAMFVTVFVGILDLSNGHFVYADGGHCPPLWKHGRKYEFLKMKKGSMLGLIEQPFEQQSIDLSEGDVIFLYTDGVSEAMNEEGKQFTEPRIKFTLNTMPPKHSVEEILSEVLNNIKQFAGNAEQSDDITMLGLRYNGKQ